MITKNALKTYNDGGVALQVFICVEY